MGETSETMRITMTVDEAQRLADFLKRNSNYEFQPCAEESEEVGSDYDQALLSLAYLRGSDAKLGIKIQMAILRSQL